MNLILDTFHDGAHASTDPTDHHIEGAWRVFADGRRVAALAGLLALALTGQPASAQPDYRAEVTARVPVPVGCAITRAYEDLTAEAVCAGGYLVWLDAQPGDKALDIPYAVGSYAVGPDANGRMWEYAILD